MAKRNSNSTPQIPAHLAALNALATAGGLRVTSEESNEDGAHCLLITWSGIQAQFYSLGLMPLHWRFPMIRGRIRLVGGYREDMSLEGEIDVSGDRFTMMFSQPRALSIQQNGSIEILDYGTKEIFHGSQEALVAQGFCKPKHFPKTQKRGGKCHGYRCDSPEREWFTRRQPDGRFLFYLESEHSCKQRVEEYKREFSPERMNPSDRVAGILDRWLHEKQTPQTEAQFRAYAMDLVMRTVVMMANGMAPGSVKLPFKLHEEQGKKFIHLGCELVHIITNGKLVNEAFVKQCRDSAAAAQTDAAFQRFMGKAAFPDAAH